MHIFYGCFLLGLGAAAPIGPVNLEIIRRNLQHGFATGFSFGAGACLADVTYLILLSVGILSFLDNQWLLSLRGIVGSFIIGWFGLMNLRLHSHFVDEGTVKTSVPMQIKGGYLMTLFNPYTILFWASVSAQIANLSQNKHDDIIMGGFGVLLGTLGWAFVLSIILQFSRKLVTDRSMHYINMSSGVILLAIAAYTFIHSVVRL